MACTVQPIAVGAGAAQAETLGAAAAAFGGENEGKLVLETRRGKDNVMGEGAKTTRWRHCWS
jgi:hypothetical protein